MTDIDFSKQLSTEVISRNFGEPIPRYYERSASLERHLDSLRADLSLYLPSHNSGVNEAYSAYVTQISVAIDSGATVDKLTFWHEWVDQPDSPDHYFYGPMHKATVLYVCARKAYENKEIDKCWSLIVSAVEELSSAKKANYLVSEYSRIISYQTGGGNYDASFSDQVRKEVLRLASELSDEDIRKLIVNKKRTKKRKNTDGVKKLTIKAVMEMIEEPIKKMYIDKNMEYKASLDKKVALWVHHQHGSFASEFRSIFEELKRRSERI